MSNAGIVSLDPNNNEHVSAAAVLHKTLLGESPIPRLGYIFMTRFYYKKLIEAGLIHCDLFMHDGKYVGFIVYTKYPYTFMKEGKSRYFLCLSFLLFQSILLNPFRIRTIIKVIQQNQARQKREEDRRGELLSFGVLEPYTKLVDRATGLRISNLLFENAMSYFKKEGFNNIQMVVPKDNMPVRFFYQSYGSIFIEDHDYTDGTNYVICMTLR